MVVRNNLRRQVFLFQLKESIGASSHSVEEIMSATLMALSTFIVLHWAYSFFQTTQAFPSGRKLSWSYSFRVTPSNFGNVVRIQKDLSFTFTRGSFPLQISSLWLLQTKSSANWVFSLSTLQAAHRHLICQEAILNGFIWARKCS